MTAPKMGTGSNVRAHIRTRTGSSENIDGWVEFTELIIRKIG